MDDEYLNFDEVVKRLIEAEDLLIQAMDHMDNTHGYESEVYQAIQAYFGEGGEDE